MNTIKNLFRSLLKKGQDNVIKILSLAIGLSVGLVLISKVFFDQSYDNFYPDGDRIYQLQLNYVMGDAEPASVGSTSGAIAPGIRAEIAGVENATRYFPFGDTNISMADLRNIKAVSAMADSNFFDMLPRKILVGNAKEVLSRPMYALISESLNEKLGGDAVGKTFEMALYPGRVVTIGGIFEDYPPNSHIKCNVYISMESISQFSRDGRNNWFGNERYISYVKLASGQPIEPVEAAAKELINKRLSEIAANTSNIRVWYTFTPIDEVHSSNPDIARTALLLTLLAIILISVSILNYILIVSSTIIARIKDVAIRKCFGAEKSDISKMMYVETAIHLVLSLIIAAILILIFRGAIQDILSSDIGTLFSAPMLLTLAILCVFILIVTGIVPSLLASRISVTNAVSRSKQSKRAWRLGLLFVQFSAVAYLVTLLAIVGLQYKAMITDSPGYEYDKLVYCELSGTSQESRITFYNQLQQEPSVELASACFGLPISQLSGNNVSMEKGGEDLFNIGDYYDVTSTFVPTMGIQIVDGANFKDGESATNDILVSQSFIDRMHILGHWKDGSPIGQTVRISEHSQNPNITEWCTVRGVYADFRQGTINNQDDRPTVMFYTKWVPIVIVAKLRQFDDASIRNVQTLLTKHYPDRDLDVKIYQDEIVLRYRDALQFRDTIFIGGIITLLIAIIGLIGYTRSEVNRRQKEIAIRKISGSTLSEVIRLFVRDILWLSIPAIVTGEVLSVFTANKWMESFSERAALSPLLFIACGAVTLIIILAVVVIHSSRIANTNPIETLRKD